MTKSGTKVGFIGLGIMGAPMALNLIKAGHTLFVASRSKIPAELAEAGATVCTNATEVAKRADVIFTMVPDTPHVQDVLFGETGVANGLSAGKTVVDMSSISPMATKQFAQQINALGCDYLDAPRHQQQPVEARIVLEAHLAQGPVHHRHAGLLQSRVEHEIAGHAVTSPAAAARASWNIATDTRNVGRAPANGGRAGTRSPP